MIRHYTENERKSNKSKRKVLKNIRKPGELLMKNIFKDKKSGAFKKNDSRPFSTPLCVFWINPKHCYLVIISGFVHWNDVFPGCGHVKPCKLGIHSWCGQVHDKPTALKLCCLLIREVETPLFVRASWLVSAADLRALSMMKVMVCVFMCVYERSQVLPSTLK